MGAHSMANRHWGWPTRIAVGAGGLVVVAGAAVLVTLVLGRPRVSVSSSSRALVEVHLSGFGTELTGVHASKAGQPVALIRDATGLVPSSQLAQGVAIQVTATAVPPSWLRWLLGTGVSTTKTVRTTAAKPSGAVALASEPGRVPVLFDNPVSVVDYHSEGGPPQVAHLAQPATVAYLDVAPQITAGSLRVAAAPLPWETVAAHPSTVTWFLAPSGGGPVALGDPAPGSSTAAANAAITLTFEEPVAKLFGSTRPTLSPGVAGAWSEPGPETLVFTPSEFGFGPGASVTVTFDQPVSVLGLAAAGATSTTAATASTSYHFRTSPGSVLRLQQLLAQLQYLPLSFTPGAGVTTPTTFAGEVATISNPLAGSFSWRWASTPASLQAEWTPGSATVMVKGALMAFEAAQGPYDGYTLEGETMGQMANASTWKALLLAALANKVDPNPYAYVYVTETRPETLTLWQNGSVVLTSPANTGIAGDPTPIGTFPIYLRYNVNYMSGTNPDGTPYHDLVHWINYFSGGSAVHGFVRRSYGFPQSLACVELPVGTAGTVFSHLGIGDLVTVE